MNKIAQIAFVVWSVFMVAVAFLFGGTAYAEATSSSNGSVFHVGLIILMMLCIFLVWSVLGAFYAYSRGK